MKRWVSTLEFLDREYFSVNLKKYEELFRIVDKERKIVKLEKDLRKILIEPTVILPFMSIGRLFLVEGLGWVPLINISRSQGNIYIDFFTIVQHNKKKILRDKVKCNC